MTEQFRPELFDDSVQREYTFELIIPFLVI